MMEPAINSQGTRNCGLHARDGGAVIFRGARMRGQVQGLLLEMTLEQHYANPGTANIEAVYTFPLPPGAVLLGMEVDLGGRRMHGEVTGRARAANQYEDALDAGDSAVLLERAADGLYTASIGNLMAGEAAVVRLRYGLLLAMAQGQVRIMLPTVIAPRFGDPQAAGLLPHQAPQTDVLADYRLELSLTLHGAMAAAQLSSPSHAVHVRGVDGFPDRMELTVRDGARLDRDVVIVADGMAGEPMAVLGRDGGRTVALASFYPRMPRPLRETAHKLPAPLVLKLLVDCSGSMNGDSIMAARRALHEIVAELEETDSFSFSRFGDQVRHVSGGMVAASRRTVRLASDWIAATHADMGGTELATALQSVIGLGHGQPADIVLITDGETWYTEDVIAAARRAGQRVFVIGIGAAPAAGLLAQIAAATGGACEFVAPGDAVHAAMARCFKRLRQPQAQVNRVAWDHDCAWRAHRRGAIFYEETLHAFAGFWEGAPQHARLEWQAAQAGQTDRAQAGGALADGGADDAAAAPWSCTVAVAPLMLEGDTLARMAAAARLAELGPADREALALQYQLVTEATSMVLTVERDGRERARALPQLRTVPQMQAAGWGGMGSARTSALDGMKAPAVWRRESASEQVRAMQRNGMDSYDIPAFLRKAAEDMAPEMDTEVETLRSRDMLVDFLYGWASRPAGSVHGNLSLWRSITGLEDSACVPADLIEALRALVVLGSSEHEVILAFLAALAPLEQQERVSRKLRHHLQLVVREAANFPDLRDQVAALVARALEKKEMVPRRLVRRRGFLQKWLGGRSAPGYSLQGFRDRQSH